MIAKLKGIVDHVETETCILDVGGVGYLVAASSRTLGQMAPGAAVSLWIETVIREDQFSLFGFLSVEERDWFRLLTTVQGVGAKVALAMLSILSPEMLLQAIAAGDKAAITRAPGVGPKLAARLLTELKDKVGNLALGAVATQPRASGDTNVTHAVAGNDALIKDAASALANLGYGASDALGAAARAAGTLGEETTLDALIREGLRELSPLSASQTTGGT